MPSSGGISALRCVARSEILEFRIEPARDIVVTHERGERFDRSLAEQSGKTRKQRPEPRRSECTRIAHCGRRRHPGERALERAPRLVVGCHHEQVVAAKRGAVRKGDRANCIDRRIRCGVGAGRDPDRLRRNARDRESTALPRRGERKALVIQRLGAVHADLDANSPPTQQPKQRPLHGLGICKENDQPPDALVKDAPVTHRIANRLVTVGNACGDQQTGAPARELGEHFELGPDIPSNLHRLARRDALERLHRSRRLVRQPRDPPHDLHAHARIGFAGHPEERRDAGREPVLRHDRSLEHLAPRAKRGHIGKHRRHRLDKGRAESLWRDDRGCEERLPERPGPPKQCAREGRREPLAGNQHHRLREVERNSTIATTPVAPTTVARAAADQNLAQRLRKRPRGVKCANDRLEHGAATIDLAFDPAFDPAFDLQLSLRFTHVDLACATPRTRGDGIPMLIDLHRNSLPLMCTSPALARSIPRLKPPSQKTTDLHKSF